VTGKHDLSRSPAWGRVWKSIGFGLFAIFLSAQANSIGDWPKFLGPNADGTSAETGLLSKIPPAGPAVHWKRTVGTGYSAPSVLDQKLVLFHRLKNEEVVECMQSSTGSTLWKHSYATTYEDPYGYNNGPRCTPLLTSNRCYTFGAEGKLLCLDLQTGKPVWTRDTTADWSIPSAFFGVGSTPWLEGDKLLVMVGGQPQSGMVAFDANTGKTLWESVGRKNWEGQPMIGWPGDRTVVWNPSEKQASYASPIVATIHGRRVAFCLMRQGLVALNPENGEVWFSRWFRSRLNDSVNATTPLITGDQIFVSATYYRVGSFLLQVKPSLKDFDQVWAGLGMELHWSQPFLVEGHLYGFTGRNEPDASFRCIEFKTGKTLWDREESWVPRSSPTPPVFGRAAAILAEKKLIVLGEGGLLGIFAPTPEAPHEISRWQVPELHYPCWVAPVLSRKKLYLRSEDRLYCLDWSSKP